MGLVVLLHRILQQRPHAVHVLARLVLVRGVVLADAAPGGRGVVTAGRDDAGVLLDEVAEERLGGVDDELKLLQRWRLRKYFNLIVP